MCCFNNKRKSFGFQIPGVYRNRKISNSEKLLLMYIRIFNTIGVSIGTFPDVYSICIPKPKMLYNIISIAGK